MGAGASSSMGRGGVQETELGDLPESCIAELMLHLDPPGICKLAKLSRTFRGAASGDFVWETKLPRNYLYLLEKASDEVEHRVPLTKKEIYAQLCRRNPFDGGTKEFWLEKYKGRLCMSISSKALLITGIDDRRYWSNIPTEESRTSAPDLAVGPFAATDAAVDATAGAADDNAAADDDAAASATKPQPRSSSVACPSGLLL